jgi:hypothetical protein
MARAHKGCKAAEIPHQNKAAETLHQNKAAETPPTGSYAGRAALL